VREATWPAGPLHVQALLDVVGRWRGE
jgi:hypothetical protein